MKTFLIESWVVSRENGLENLITRGDDEIFSGKISQARKIGRKNCMEIDVDGITERKFRVTNFKK